MEGVHFIMRCISLEEFPSLECATVDWVIPGLVPKPGIITLIGSPKAGKSLLAAQMALAIARGEPF